MKTNEGKKTVKKPAKRTPSLIDGFINILALVLPGGGLCCHRFYCDADEGQAQDLPQKLSPGFFPGRGISSA